jgi:hypothetical protein
MRQRITGKAILNKAIFLQVRVRNSCLEDGKVKCFNAIAGGEGTILYVL